MSKVATTTFIIFMALFSLANMTTLSQIPTAPEICAEVEYRPASFTDNLIKTLNKLERRQRAIKLQEELKKDIFLINPLDAVRIFQKVRFHYRDITKVSQIIDGYILRFSPDDVVKIVKNVKRRLQPKVAIAFANTLSDVSKESKQKIVMSVECESSRAKVIKALANIKKRSCFFGKIDSNVVFVIDLSGSMTYKMKIKGKGMSRWQFLKPFIISAINGLPQESVFKIITFATRVKYWKNVFVPATRQNKYDAVKYINKVRPIGNTDTLGGIKEAFKQQRKEYSMILFTDGMPTVGETNIQKILAYIKEKNKKRVKRGLIPVKIHINVVTMGGKEKQAEKDEVSVFAKDLARATQGTYKNFK